MKLPPPGLADTGRPKRTFETGPVTKALRIAAVALGAALWIAVTVRFPSMPAEIPTHFGISGEADGWGSKGSIFLLMGIFTALLTGLTWVSHYPRSFNYLTWITEENAQQVYRRGEQMLVWLTCSMTLLFTGIVLGTIFAFNPGILIAIAGIALVVSVVAGLILTTRAGRGV